MKPMDATGLIYYKINNSSVKLDITLKKILSRFRLTPSQFMFLSVLEKHKKTTSKIVGMTLSLDPSSLTPLIKRLLTSEYILRLPSHDKRSYSLTMTEKGRIAYQNSISVISEFEERLLNELTAEEKMIFDSTLQKIDRFVFKIQKQLLY